MDTQAGGVLYWACNSYGGRPKSCPGVDRQEVGLAIAVSGFDHSVASSRRQESRPTHETNLPIAKTAGGPGVH